MNCPACGKTLQEKTVGDITVDVCEGGCGGIWFDNYELEKVDEAHEAAGEALLDVQRAKATGVDYSQKWKCPKCSDQPMKTHFVSVKRQVEVDECPACGGFWLDCGELAAIRTQFASEKERNAAAEKYFTNVFGDDIEKMRAASQEKLANARKIAKMFRFICPSHYIPGKQAWGAF